MLDLSETQGMKPHHPSHQLNTDTSVTLLVAAALWLLIKIICSSQEAVCFILQRDRADLMATGLKQGM